MKYINGIMSNSHYTACLDITVLMVCMSCKLQ